MKQIFGHLSPSTASRSAYRGCATQRVSIQAISNDYPTDSLLAIAGAGVVTYCYSEERWLQYLQRKIASLQQFIAKEHFPIVEREIGKDGIYGSDGDLLTRKCILLLMDR